VTLPPYGSLFVVFREKADTVSIKTIAKDDIIVSDTERFPVIERKLYPEVKDNFTISFWAKPELQVMLSTDNFMEYVKDPWTDYYAVYPASGNALYGKGHFTAGLAVGRNGVAVWEHGENPPVMVLAASEPISGWSHIALVYKQGTPSVYVNGRLIKKGDKAGKNIHPGTGPAYLNEGASYYNGDMTEPQLNMEVLSEEKIKEIASRTFEKKMDWIKIVEPVQNKVPSLLFRENGEYTLTDTLGKSKKLTVAGINEPVFLDGSWDVYFPPAMGAPEKITLPRLTSLHLHQESGVKYFSGTATYTKSFTLATDAIAQGKHIFLDLGGVEVIAEVIVNGKNLGILWSRPYMIEITGALKIGVNEISIKVTNQWVNRLIGDEQLPDEDKFVPGAGSSGFAGLIGGAIEKLPEWYLQGKPKPENGRVTFTTWKHYRKDSPLLESGLIGPVILRSAVSKKIV
ncbi:MAG: glycosylhydrolase-like jelly roll fold domain-containing protein, partial [Cytophagaceae bacterium]